MRRVLPKICCPILALCLVPGPLHAQRGERSQSDFKPITPEQMEAVELGLAHLASLQVRPAGYWRADIGYKLNLSYNVTTRRDAHVGVTALSVMAFLAGGHLPGRGKYGQNVQEAVEWLMSQVTGDEGGQEDGFVSANGSRMYSHAFATLALAEVYGMYFPREREKRQRLREALDRSVRFTFSTQNDEGGWRYHPLAPDSDISITVCQIMALRAANNVGISVPDVVIEKAKDYVRDSAVNESYGYSWGNAPTPRGAFRYQRTPNSRTSFALTAAGVTTLFGAGVYADDEIVQRGVKYLSSNHRDFTREWGLGDRGLYRRGHYFFYYGHYYGVQAMYQAGGAMWEDYFENTRQNLLIMQDRSTGAWPNDVGPGEAFGTAVAALVLQIPYNYLPIFQR